MKRFSVLTAAMALAAVVLTGCEDVPSPFGTVTPPSQTTPASDMPTVGTGVVTDPYNVQAVLEYVKSLGADVESPEEVYVKGIVTSISEISTQYGNASFVLSDDADGSNKFTAYRVKGFGNQKVSDENIVKIGDEVIVCGKVVYYRGNTPETVQNSSYVYSVNGNTGGGQTPTPTPTVEAKGSGTQADPYNVQAVYNIVSALAADTDTEAEYYVNVVYDPVRIRRPYFVWRWYPGKGWNEASLGYRIDDHISIEIYYDSTGRDKVGVRGLWHL